MTAACCAATRCVESTAWASAASSTRTGYATPDLVAAAGAELRALRDISGETTYLAALDGLEVVSQERCEVAHSQRSHSALGQRKPLHCTSQGKAILSALPPERRDALVKEIELMPVTPRSITDRRRLQAERAVALDGARQPLPDWPRRRFSAITRDREGTLWTCLPDGECWRVAALSREGSLQGGWRLGEPATNPTMCARTRTLYIAAADSGALYAAPIDQSNLRRLATVPKGSGRLGGLAVDAAGGVWAALRGGWSAVRFGADGTMDRVLALPVPNPTAVALGGVDGDTLFITSERHALAREALDAAPLSGRLFALDGATS